jgi:RNA polymerase sigma-70 factor, ECF subfamily
MSGFEAVALPHFSAAYNLARWITRNDSDAADVVQEAYARALRFFDGYRGGDARSWLLQIVRNTAHSWLAVNRPAGGLPIDDELCDAAHDPERIVAAERDAEQLREAIAQLPMEHREVLILREFEQMSYREIAAVVDAPMGTVMSRLARARDQLAKRVRARHGERR